MIKLANKQTIFTILVLLLASCTNVKENKVAEYSLLRGLNLSQKGDYEQAMGEYKTSYALNPNNPILLKEMAYTYFTFKDYKNSEIYYLKALKISPKDDEIIKNLVALYYKTNKFDKINDTIKKSYNPNNNFYLKMRGLVALKNQNKILAKQLFSKIDIKYFDAPTYILYLNLDNKNLDRKLKLGYKLFKNSKEYNIYYAKKLMQQKEYKKAEQILLEYLTNYNDIQIIDTLASIYKASGNKKGYENCIILKREVK